MSIKIGVIGVQGDVQEHIEAWEQALKEEKIKGGVIWLRRPQENIDAVSIPGGESTTITKLMRESGLWDFVKRRAEDGMPVLGTCAGLIVISKIGVGSDVDKSGQPFMGLLDCKVNRNFFGRQRESFETDLSLSFLSEPFRAVFIRAPAIMEVFGKAEVVAKLPLPNPESRLEQSERSPRGLIPNPEVIVGAEQGNILGLAFHPELTGDLRIHKYFLNKVQKK